MKKKILGVLSVVMLSGAILLGGQSMDAEAANKSGNTNECRHWRKGTMASFSYSHADNYKHREQVRILEFCYDCPDYHVYRYYECVENHSTPNNNPCECGFTPPRY